MIFCKTGPKYERDQENLFTGPLHAQKRDSIAGILNSSPSRHSYTMTAVAPLAWVPWVPGSPSIFDQWVPEPINFDQWVPEPINFGKKGL